MNEKSVSAHVAGFGRRLLGAEVVTRFPETRIIPQYLRDHFPGARSVLDLGFGTGVWFWSSFLPSLERVDGFDLYQEALDEADRVLSLPEPPPGYRAAHEWIGSQTSEALVLGAPHPGSPDDQSQAVPLTVSEAAVPGDPIF